MLSVLVVVALRRYDKAYYHCNEQSEYEKQLIFNKTNRQATPPIKMAIPKSIHKHFTASLRVSVLS